MPKDIIRHFVSGASGKGLVQEKVVAGSESDRFLKRINLPKKQQPCFHAPDMRNKAPGPHREVQHDNKVMYLDDISYQIFQQGLKENNGVFTIGTYEKIMYGPHTYMGSELTRTREQKKHGLDLLVQEDKKRQWIHDESKNANVIGLYAPDILHLGYLPKRQSPRLSYVMPVTIHHKDQTVSAKTRDISTGGLQVFLTRTLFSHGEIISIDLDGFIDDIKQLTDKSKSRFFQGIQYKVIDIKHRNNKVYLGLQQLDLNDYARNYIAKFIQTHRLQYKIDAEDTVLCAQSRFVEHLYTYNMVNVPLILSKRDNHFFVDHIIETRQNKKLVDFFIYPNVRATSYDFTPFMYPHRTFHLAGQALLGGLSLFFAYWKNNKLVSIFDFELKSCLDLAFFVLQVKQHKGKIFSISAENIDHPSDNRIRHVLQQKLQFDEEQIQGVLEHNKTFVAQLLMTDITDIFQNDAFYRNYFRQKDSEDYIPQAWYGQNKVNAKNGEILGRTRLSEDLNVTRASIYFQKERFHLRYEYQIPVEIQIQHQVFKTQTIDFSKTGLGLRIPAKTDLPINHHSFALLTFPEFAERIPDINFKNISYRIARVNFKPGYIELGLVLVKDEKNRAIEAFFDDLINRNKARLNVSRNDSFEHTYNVVLRTYIEKNINSIQLEISKDKLNKQYLKYVCIKEVASKMAEHFFLKLRGYHFKMLTSRERLDEIYTRTLRGNTKSDQSFVLFMYRDINERGVEFINSYASYELEYQSEIMALLPKVFENQGACIKFTFYDELEMDNDYIQRVIQLVSNVNTQRGRLFKRELADIVGLVDLTDVTLAYKMIYELYTDES